jgi:hypothetical protein
MRNLFLAAFLTMAAFSFAKAQTPTPAPASVNLPTKAPSFAVYPLSSGWFYGVSASGMGGAAAASGAVGGPVIGGRFGADFGYTGLVANTFYFVEGSVSGQAISGASQALGIIASVNLEERFAVGVPQNIWNEILALIPGLSSVAFPTVPVLNGVAAGPSNLYTFLSLYQDDVSATLGSAVGHDWLLSYGAGVGILNRLTNGMMLDTSIEWKHSASGMLVGASLVYPWTDAYLATVRLKF